MAAQNPKFLGHHISQDQLAVGTRRDERAIVRSKAQIGYSSASGGQRRALVGGEIDDGQLPILTPDRQPATIWGKGELPRRGQLQLTPLPPVHVPQDDAPPIGGREKPPIRRELEIIEQLLPATENLRPPRGHIHQENIDAPNRCESGPIW